MINNALIEHDKLRKAQVIISNRTYQEGSAICFEEGD